MLDKLFKIYKQIIKAIKSDTYCSNGGSIQMASIFKHKVIHMMRKFLYVYT